ncbi:LuxR C-terminal-related transcriptional regulator [Amycolatopsis regifaucium]|uniref:LuxR family transcriptional regulator n=1 Tax=Amycolatopsis regifaucium TaxID=546365 RepID=A0A154MW95_9PSEU|nr:LuxR C-terminal-related transcriptional regulator [Amycolatopsis regifaucium]KZB88644.1 serine/threonine protein phosphatase [Amycolatopsis regifaucium]OKA07187.1 LuxR family transcriptional regulator [Amycolatopsis regifaucium]SFI54760.1 non-specific serine/threonine protein kinase [Amycolatopsis regifaucium]
MADGVGLLSGWSAEPAEVTSYVGRDAETGEARRLLEAASLVTLTGPGGVGKTRLAWRIATAHREATADDVAFVSLAELREPALLVPTVANVLGFGDRSAKPAIDVVVEALRESRLLLVLDNCEHLVESCARFADTVVRECPQVSVLATSRQSLGVAGERILPVPPLAVPQQGDSFERAVNYESVRLFVDRATAVAPSFRLTESDTEPLIRLCRRLDGLPLAIELAAVRALVLSLRQLADRLDRQFSVLTKDRRGRPERHETMRALIDWSHELCTGPERLLWARASVFSGSFDLDAAEEVCSGGDLPREHVLEVVDGLLDKSILLREEYPGGVRYRMLESVREYGADRLSEAGGTTEFRKRHRDWFAELSARYAAEWLKTDQLAWIARLRREHANLRVALDFCAGAPEDAVVGLRMLRDVKEFWIVRGLNTEGRMWVRRLDETAAPGVPERAHGLWLSGFLALVQGDLSAHRSMVDRAAAEAETSGDELAAAYVLHVRAYAALIGNDMSEAARLFGAAIDLFRIHGDEGAEIWASYNYGLAVWLDGDIDRGRTVLTESVERCERRGEVFWRGWALWSRAAAEYLQGDFVVAGRCCEQILRLHARVDDRVVVGFTLTVMAGCAARTGRPNRAAILQGAAMNVWRTVGAWPTRYEAFTEPLQADVDVVTTALGWEVAVKEFTDGSAMSTGDAIAYALGERSPEPRKQAARVLTKRETEIAHVIAEGLTNQEIADRLGIARRTVDTHIDHILTKLGYSNRVQVATWVTRTAEQA